MGLINKSQVKKVVKELDQEDSIGSVGEEVGSVLEKKAQEILEKGIERAKENKRRTLQGKDL